MSKVTKDNRHQKVIRHNDGRTEVWEKDSTGNTRKSGHSTYNPNTGNTTDHHGKIISTDGRNGSKKSKK